MKIIFTFFLASMLSLLCSAQHGNRLIVGFKPGITYEVNYETKKVIHPKLLSLPVMDQLLELNSIVKKGLPEPKNLKAIDRLRDIHFITLPDNADAVLVIADLMGTGLFEFVEQDATGAGAGVNLTTPNDGLFANQWGLRNLGTFSSSAVADADIDMDNAWDITTGTNDVIVAVLDAGFKLDHPELAGRIWVNSSEISGNGIDDDGNGYIDDDKGWDWANNDNNATDDHGHGSNVGSIISAKGNNITGMAGINWNCKLMVCKVLSSNNSGFYSWWISAIYYAVAKGAKVINMSLGGSSSSAAMQAACDFAMANNVVIVACMHNQNTSTPYYPAAFSSVIAVGSTSDNDSRTVPFPWDPLSGSNYGSHVDLVAPGNLILGISNTSNTTFNYWAGTSQATPAVAGVVSLMFGLKSDLSFSQVMNILSTTSEDLVGNPVEDVPGWDQYYGWGRLNAQSALVALLSLVPLQFGDVNAYRNGMSNEIRWTTHDEYNVSSFSVEYSSDRVNWQAVKQVTPSSSTEPVKTYSVFHFISAQADAYYRIRVIDYNGQRTYSKIVRVNRNPSDMPFAVNSIVVNQQSLNLNIHTEKEAVASFSIIDMNGKLVYKNQRWVSAGQGSLHFDINLAAGRYQLVIHIDHERLSEGFLIR